MRLRSLVLLLLGLAAAVGIARRRRPAEFVDVHFEDGSSMRFTGGIEARDLLEDAYAIVETAP